MTDNPHTGQDDQAIERLQHQASLSVVEIGSGLGMDKAEMLEMLAYIGLAGDHPAGWTYDQRKQDEIRRGVPQQPKTKRAPRPKKAPAQAQRA